MFETSGDGLRHYGLTNAPSNRIGNCMIGESFARTMRENLTSGSVPFRKAYLRSLVDMIEVDDAQIRIKGSKDVLERAVLAGRAGSESGSQMSTNWRTRHDSNVWPPPSEGGALSS